MGSPSEQSDTSVGLDLHARSVVACGLGGATGRVFERRVTPEHREILAWIATLPPPIKDDRRPSRSDRVSDP